MNREEALSIYQELKDNEQLVVQALKGAHDWASGVTFENISFIFPVSETDVLSLADRGLVQKGKMVYKDLSISRDMEFQLDTNGNRYRLTEEFYNSIHDEDIFDPEEE